MALSGHQLGKRFAGKQVVKNVTLTIQAGDIVGLFGPNGAGKTTTFLMMAGLLSPDEGSICLGQTQVTRLALYQRARLGLRYLPQEPSIFRGMTVQENVLAALEMAGTRRSQRPAQVQALLQAFSIEHLKNSSALSLSGGERRRVEMARALVGNPSFLLLDEPLAGVDPRSVREVGDLMRRLAGQGLGILVTDHNVKDMLPLVTHAYVMQGGEILASGPPQTIIQNPAVRQAYLGTDFVLN